MTSLNTTGALIAEANQYMRTSRSAKHRQAIRVWMLVLLLQHEGGTDYRSNLDGLVAAYADRVKFDKEQMDANQTAIFANMADKMSVTMPTADELNLAIVPLMNEPRLDHIEQALLNRVVEILAGPQ